MLKKLEDDGWLKVSFSSLKRTLGETVRASSVDGMTREVLMKFLVYQIIVNFGKGLV
jgi:hypothetical protein